MLLGVMVFGFPQMGTNATEQYFRLDPLQYPQFCTATVVKDCVVGVRFWRFDAQGQRVDVADMPVLSARNVTVNGVTLFEFKLALPKIPGNYKTVEYLYATVLSIDVDGKELEAAPPLGLGYAKRPVQGVEFGVR